MVVKNARFEDRLGGTDLPDESREVLEHLKKVYLWEDECIRDCYNSRAGVFSLFNTIK